MSRILPRFPSKSAIRASFVENNLTLDEFHLLAVVADFLYSFDQMTGGSKPIVEVEDNVCLWKKDWIARKVCLSFF